MKMIQRDELTEAHIEQVTARLRERVVRLEEMTLRLREQLAAARARIAELERELDQQAAPYPGTVTDHVGR